MKELSTFNWITIFAISSMFINGFGIGTIYKKRSWANMTKEYCMCFAAGILISSPLIISLPHALEKNSYAGFLALIGFIFMYFSNKIIKYKTKQKELAFGITAMEGIAIHSLMDGVIYTVTFSMSTAIGVLTGVGLVIHEFAEGIITFSVLIKGGMNEKKAGIYAFIVAGLTTPVGAFVVYPIVRYFSEDILGLAMGFVSGVLIYISASHLLPEAGEHEKKHSTLAFIAGIAFALVAATMH